MPLDLSEISAEDAVLTYLRERHRRGGIRSLAGKEPDMPRSTAPSDGLWEQLLGLVRGIPDRVLEAMEMVQFGYMGKGQWQPMHTDPDAEGVSVELPAEQVCDPMPVAKVAEKLKVDPVRLRAAIREARLVIAENLARLKGYAREPSSGTLLDQGPWRRR